VAGAAIGASQIIDSNDFRINYLTAAVPGPGGKVATPDPVAEPTQRAALDHDKPRRIRPSRRLDSAAIRALQERKSGEPAAPVTIHAPKGTNRKHLLKTMASAEGATTAACYLCNTHSKTDKAPCREAVPLLRV
jgi:hypothetical protein